MNILDYTFDNYLNGNCPVMDCHTHIKQSEGFKLICYGLIPSGFPMDKHFENDDIKIGLGFHPYAVENADAKEIDVFKHFVDDAKFIGEIGLDFSEKHRNSKEKQLIIFEEISKILSEKKDKVISIHAVKSSVEVLDILDTYRVSKNNLVILHWFSGTSDELKRALDSGYYFSVGPKMLATNKGHEYIRQIPENKMLLETDLPWNSIEVTCEEHLNLLNDFAMQIRELKSY